MQENDNGQQRTEQPTPKRIDKARKDGQVARSRELSTTLLFLFGSLSFFFFGALLSTSLQSIMDLNFEFDRASIMDPSLMIAHLYDSFFSYYRLNIFYFIIFYVRWGNR